MNDIRKRPPANSPPSAAPKQRRLAKSTNPIEIRLLLPRLKTPGVIRTAAVRARALSRRQKVIVIIAALVLIGTTVFLQNQSSESTATKPDSQNPLDMLEKGTPDYATLLPAGKDITELGGWTRISPKERTPVFAYVDRIGDIPVSVSQQPLPDDFAPGTDDKIRNLALGSNATKKLSAAGTTVYLSTPSKGAQSAIFTKDDLLILIKATTSIEDDDWKSYLSSLR